METEQVSETRKQDDQRKGKHDGYQNGHRRERREKPWSERPKDHNLTPIVETYTLADTLMPRVVEQIDWFYKRKGIRDPEEDIARAHGGQNQGSVNYNSFLADLLAYASTWAYADPATFAFMMAHRGMKRWRFYYMRLGNDPLFVVSSAYLMQSYTGDAAILVFRGTEPTNMLNWLTDLTVKPERFHEGEVHGGILRNLRAIWPLVTIGLYSLEQRANLKLLEKQREKGEKPTDYAGPKIEESQFYETAYGLRSAAPDKPAAPMYDDIERSLRPLKALYITGHSLGGAMAALAAVELWKTPMWEDVRANLHGCYTYGAPMVASPVLADGLEASLGKRVFRHVYASDVVPRLPPMFTGRFKHFGTEYRGKRDGKGWLLSSPAVMQTRQLLTLPLAGMGMVLDQFPLLRGFVQYLPLSIDDHSPRHYMRTSELSQSAMF